MTQQEASDERDGMLFDVLFALVEKTEAGPLVSAALDGHPDLQARVMAHYGDLPASEMPKRLRQELHDLLTAAHEEHFDA